MRARTGPRADRGRRPGGSGPAAPLLLRGSAAARSPLPSRGTAPTRTQRHAGRAAAPSPSRARSSSAPSRGCRRAGTGRSAAGGGRRVYEGQRDYDARSSENRDGRARVAGTRRRRRARALYLYISATPLRLRGGASAGCGGGVTGRVFAPAWRRAPARARAGVRCGGHAPHPPGPHHVVDLHGVLGWRSYRRGVIAPGGGYSAGGARSRGQLNWQLRGTSYSNEAPSGGGTGTAGGEGPRKIPAAGARSLLAPKRPQTDCSIRQKIIPT